MKKTKRSAKKQTQKRKKAPAKKRSSRAPQNTRSREKTKKRKPRTSAAKHLAHRKKTPKSKTGSGRTRRRRAGRAEKIYCAPHECFWVNFGPILASLEELERAFSVMRMEQFRYHTKGNKNDFAKWVKEVMNEEKLSRELYRAKTPVRARMALIRHIRG